MILFLDQNLKGKCSGCFSQLPNLSYGELKTHKDELERLLSPEWD